MMKQLEKLSNSELQKLYAKDKARGQEQVWARRSHKVHLENLRKLQEQARGQHGRNIRKGVR